LDASAARSAAIADSGLLEPGSTDTFDRFARIAGGLLAVPATFVALAARDGHAVIGRMGGLRSLPAWLPDRVITTAEPIQYSDAGLVDEPEARAALEQLSARACYAMPIRLADGSVVGALVALSSQPRQWTRHDGDLLQDLTAATAHEIDMHISERRQAAIQDPAATSRLLNLLPVGLYASDATGRIVFFNERASAMWGHSPPVPSTEAAVFRHSGLSRVDGEALLETDLPAAACLRDNSTATNREYLMSPGRTVLVSWGPSLGRREQLLGAVVVMQDVTDVRRATRLRDELLALVSHELRTPLTIINGMAHFLESRELGQLDGEASVAVTDIVAAGQRMERMVENMLLLSRLEHESTEPEPILVSLALDSAIRRHRRDFPGSRVEVDIRDRALMVQAVPAWLQLILVNLLNNAEQYGDRSAPHSITAIEAGGAAEVSVCNAGLPLTPAEYVGWFEPFYRNSETATAVSGAGLGLTVARRLAEAQGGSIVARPWPVARGTMVTLTLPRPSEDL
jgi:signal transduction histidine kinase